MKNLFALSVLVFLIAAGLVFMTIGKGREKRELAQRYFGKGPPGQLVIAALMGDKAGVNKQLTAGVNINCLGERGMTPLVFSFLIDDKRAIELLLEMGADPNRYDNDGDSAVSLAAYNSDLWYLKTVLKHGGKANAGNGNINRAPIMQAVMSYSLPNVQLLVQAGANVNYQDAVSFETPMMAACTLNRYDIVYWLLQSGADPTLRDSGGDTILWRIQHWDIDPASPLAADKQKVIDWLKQRNLWKEEKGHEVK
jgi:ankyrin repeat protein